MWSRKRSFVKGEDSGRAKFIAGQKDRKKEIEFDSEGGEYALYLYINGTSRSRNKIACMDHPKKAIGMQNIIL